MSEVTRSFIDNIVKKDYLKAREDLKSAVDATIKSSIESSKEKIRQDYSDE